MTTKTTHPVFSALDEKGSGAITTDQIMMHLAQTGFSADDPRLAGLNEGVRQLVDPRKIDATTFASLLQRAPAIVERAVRGELVIPQFAEFSAQVEEVFEKTRSNRNGEVASYIPQLARVAPDHFAVALCTIDGQQLQLGDAHLPFSIQCVCKPMLYGAALEELGENRVHKHVGREPSGQSFNELTLNKDQRPHNPMLNAGAILCAGLLRTGLPLADRFDTLTNLIGSLAGNTRPGFNYSIFRSEHETADRNFALAHYMREVGAFPEGTDALEALDLYLAACSMESNAAAVATIGATFANGGICPQTGDRVFSADTVKNCLAMMYSCGMYDYSGEFAFRVGIPAKSGVSGIVLAVIPNVMGIAVWSPRIDEHGNSVRGVEFLQRLIDTFNFHNYDSLVESTKVDPRRRRQAKESNATYSAIQAASCGDIDELKRLVAHGHDLNSADYDGRTPLHLAAAEGQQEVVQYLLAQNVRIDPSDRWGNSPLGDAHRHQRKEVVAQLQVVGDTGETRNVKTRRANRKTKPKKAA